VRTHLRRRLARRDEAGIAALLVAFFTIALFLPLASISVDVARMYIEVGRVQTAADAAALAGVTYLPGDLPDATTAALAAAAKNGYSQSATSHVTVGLGARPTQLKVTVSSTIPNTFASTFGQPATTITRSSVADYNGPAPMGSPCNTFGNEPDGTPGAPPVASQLSVPPGATCPRTPGFWANIEGPAVTKTQGDRYDTRKCAGGEYGCDSSKNNTDFDPAGEFYVVHVGTAAVGSLLTIQLYDPEYASTNAQCDGAPTAGKTSDPALADNWNSLATTDALTRYRKTTLDSKGNPVNLTQFCAGDSQFGTDSTSVPTITSFALRAPTDTYNPKVAPAEPQCQPVQYPGYRASSVTVKNLRQYTTPGDPSSGVNTSYLPQLAQVFHQWVTFCAFTPTTAGDYYLQVRSDVAMGGTVEGSFGGAWNYGNQSVLTQSGDDTSVKGDTSNVFAIRANSAQAGSVSVAGWDHMTIWANGAGTSTTFNLVRVIPAAAGQTLVLSFFDVGDAADGGTLTILPPTESTIALGGCTGTGPQPAVTSTTSLNSCQVTGIKSTSGWNGALETIHVPIPIGYTCTSTSSGGCWFRVTVNFGANVAVHDTTTWTALIQGDPVRLIQ
jgi:Flp pilus assembly protein TadG